MSTTSASITNRLIKRYCVRFDPLYGNIRQRVPPRARRRPRAVTTDADAADQRYLRQFITAFLGGFVFLSVMIL